MAKRRFLVDLDLNQNELQYPKIHNLGAAPAGATSGQLYFNTTDKQLYYWDETVWVSASGAQIEGTAPIVVTQTGYTHSVSINQVTTTTDGSMIASDKLKLDSATHSTVADTLVIRDGNGEFSAFMIHGLTAPTLATDAANKGYVDDKLQGIDAKTSCRVVSTTPVVLSGNPTVDGVSLADGDRILVAGQAGNVNTPHVDNGIYRVDAGAWTRATDSDENQEVTAGMFTFVTEGTAFSDTGWVLGTNDPIVVGTTALQFVQFSQAGVINGGDGIVKVGNTLSVDFSNTSGLTFSGGQLEVSPTIAGAGSTFTSGIVNVIGGTGITVNADDIEVDGASLEGAGMVWNSGNFDVVGGTGITVNADDIEIDGAIAGDGLSWNAVLGQLETTSTADIDEVIAGPGLTGGATQGSATLTIGQGNGILVNVDDIEVVAGTGITVDASGVNVDGQSLAGTNITWNPTLGQFESVADITEVVAGNGLVGGATQGVATLDINVGVGLTVSAGTVSALVDGTTIQTNLNGQLEVIPGTYPTKYTETVTVGTVAGVQTITHNLNSLFVDVSVFDDTTGEEYGLEVLRTNANTVTVEANGSPLAVKVVVIG